MNFLKVAEGVFVNTANILKFEMTAGGTVRIYLIGEQAPVVMVKDNPTDAAKWIAWVEPKTVNVSTEEKGK